MALLLEILDVVLPVFLVIGVGFVLRVVRFVDPATNTQLTRLVFYVAAPALLFRSVAQAPLDEVVQPTTIAVIAGTTVLFVLAVYLGTARLVPARRGVIAQGVHRSNMVFVGLPVIINACGPDVLGPAAVLIGFMVVVYNLLGVMVLVLPHRSNGAGVGGVWAKTFLEFLRNPLILASGAGLVASACGVVLPVAADRSLELVGRIAMPLALLSVGVGMDFGRLRAEWGPATLVGAVKLLVYPGLICAALYLLGLRGLDLQVPVLIMASPTAVVSYIMAKEMKGDVQLAASIVIGSTLASLFTISGWLVFLRYVA